MNVEMELPPQFINVYDIHPAYGTSMQFLNKFSILNRKTLKSNYKP